MRAVQEHSIHRRRRRAQSGASLAIAMFTMSALLVSATGGLLVASSNTFATRNYRGTQQVHFVAESALAQALQTFNQNGIRNFQADVVNQWTARYGTAARNFTPLPGFTYTVRAQADVADPINRGFFIATARGPENTMSVATASLVRSVAPFQTPGALHLARNGTPNSVQGSVWTNDVQVGVGGAAQIYYSSEALALAQIAGPGQTVNQPLAITSIADCGQVAAGVSGC